ncbi:biotin synthase BioB [Terrisporobacter glycolicus]|uniref:Biotin synthase n=1 Tax=Terrisporobacter glycolicus ATCC 14880 = DSM 1288 TaxID=1121315 RepID=A0ABZ2EVU8_9FIRM|nr:biotin synthase BioB [Terrisporobacter glycolicus]
MLKKISETIINEELIDKDTALSLLKYDTEDLCKEADKIRKHFCGNEFDLCTIVNGKSGRCSEDCKFCAQSSHYKSEVENYELLDTNSMKKEAIYNDEKNVGRYSVVTSGKKLSSKEVDSLCDTYIEIRKSCKIKLCASGGLLTYEELCKLKEAGVIRYHNNLESSKRFFSQICTTHTYDEKIETIKAAKKAGLTVCSGGIMGLGENMEDRIDLAFTLRDLGITSVPINILNPIKGTPLENNKVLTLDEVRKIVAIYRFILPNAQLRLAGGRGLLEDKGLSVFSSGANAAITGDMLTTSGITIDEDMKIIKKLGYEVKCNE